MDSLTHIAIGAAIGEVFFEKGFGKKAIGWGILAQSIPDIDFITAWWMSPSEAMIAHRGFTHSFLFALLSIFIFSLMADRWHRPHNITFTKWMFFFTAAVGGHLFIDAFNNYGIGWLEPFHHKRFAFNWIYVFDPLFLIVPLIGFVFLLVSHPYHRWRKKIASISLLVPLIYLGYCGINKQIITNKMNSVTYGINKGRHRMYTTPAPFQSWLWLVILPGKDSHHIAYRSVFDTTANMSFYVVPVNNSLITEVSNHESLQRLIRFSDSLYAIKKVKGQLVFTDLRFGQIQGWLHPENDFVFQYQLSHDEESRLMIQRGRMQGWSHFSLVQYFNRIFFR